MRAPPLRIGVFVVSLLVGVHFTAAQSLYWIYPLTQEGQQDYGIRRIDLSDLSVVDVAVLDRDISLGPRSLALDTSACTINQGTIFVGLQHGFGIQRFGMDGSGPTVLFPVVGVQAVDLAVDSTNSHLYFANDFAQESLERCDFNGGDRTALIIQNDIVEISLDVDSSKMYYVKLGDIRRANLDGSGVEDIINTNSIISEFALDPSGGKLFWNDRDNHTIVRSDLDGANVEVIVDLEAIDPFPASIAADIVVDPRTQQLYWIIKSYGQIWTAGTDGSDPQVLMQLNSEIPFVMAFDPRSDCNGNGLDDACDLASLSSQDCDGNGVPDECDADCNDNGVPDACDLAGGTSSDCNANDIPDECDTDCNDNTVPDDCDLIAGTSEDCNLDLIPDECQPNGDCNSTGTLDLCDIGAGTSEDCNDNLIPDECDVAIEDCNSDGIVDACEAADGTVADNNGNGQPDSCESCFVPSLIQPQLLPDPDNVLVPGPEQRFLAFSAGDPGHTQAIRVTFVDLPLPWKSWNSTQLYVQEPVIYSEIASRGFDQPGAIGSEPTFYAATLGCSPVYLDWSVYGMIHVYHDGIVPSDLLLPSTGVFKKKSLYSVEVIEQTCSGDPSLGVTIPVLIHTAGFGDIRNGYDIASNLVPDNIVSLADILAVLAKFSNNSGSPAKARIDMLGADSEGLSTAVDGKISVIELQNVLQAFLSADYPVVPDGPPPTCP